MKYEIERPDDVIEASVSADPDDINVARIRIKASLKDGESSGDVDEIRFTVPTSLTERPESITPVAKSFDAWEFVAGDGATFTARPKQNPPEGDEWIFFLHDVEVAVGAGSTYITVEETPAATPAIDPLKIRKVDPSLRIDHFRAIKSTTKPDDTHADAQTPLTSSLTTSGPIWLSWTTTAATHVSLFGPATALSTTDVPSTITDDDSVQVTPRTTSVYTLVASNAHAHAVAQVTVHVEDKTVVKALTADSVTSSGALTADSVKSTKGVADKNGPVIPVGLIAMWSGAANQVPAGWALCDGSPGRPDLRGRFVVGYASGDKDFGTMNSKAGERTVTLTTAQVPSHGHETLRNSGDADDSTDDGAHTHSHDTLELDWGKRNVKGALNEELNLVLASRYGTAKTTRAGSHQHRTTSVGGGGAHPNLPPYFVLAYIIKLAVT